MRSKQYFTSIKNNPHEISTDPKFLLTHNNFIGIYNKKAITEVIASCDSSNVY